MTFRRAIVANNYDSVLDPAGAGRPAKLTIRLKTALFPRDPTVAGNPGGAVHPVHLAANEAQIKRGPLNDANGNPVACRSWTVPEWNAFKIKFKKIVEMAWNNQMFLLAPDDDPGDGGLGDADFRQLIGNPRIAAHVECALDIELMSTAAGSHAQIEVVHLANDDLTFRSRMSRVSHDCVEITTRNKPQWTTTLYQFVAAHEVGHWLRDPHTKLFQHIDAAYAKTLPRAQQDSAQYGHVLGKRMAMMGSGTLLTTHEVHPWLGRVRDHTGVQLGWLPIHRVRFNNVNLVSPRQEQLLAAHP